MQKAQPTTTCNTKARTKQTTNKRQTHTNKKNKRIKQSERKHLTNNKTFVIITIESK